MSPMSRPSKVDALKRGIGTAPVSHSAVTNSPPRGQDVTLAGAPPRPVKPARITLNLPPELYRQLQQWTTSAAESIDVPRVGVQEALRAMVRVITEGQATNAEQRIYAAIRDELAR